MIWRCLRSNFKDHAIFRQKAAMVLENELVGDIDECLRRAHHALDSDFKKRAEDNLGRSLNRIVEDSFLISRLSKQKFIAKNLLIAFKNGLSCNGCLRQ